MENMLKAIMTKFKVEISSLIPGIVFGVAFLIFAYLAIRMIRSVFESSLKDVFKGKKKGVGKLILNSTTVFLWFMVVIVLFNILGMGNLAASLGTASGFAALGISFALSNVITDLVAGIYLIQDPDFSVGDRITSGSVTGTVKSVELRKCRIRTDEGNTVVLANSEVEKVWTHIEETDDPLGASPGLEEEPESNNQGGEEKSGN